MIRIERGSEPSDLAAVRGVQLAKVGAIAAKREPLSEEIKGYNVAKPRLAEAQAHKCCYCEARIEGKYDDVEHFRPKAGANRGPGFATTGYWWLAWTWENLLLACKRCNSEFKGTQFPLVPGSIVLAPHAHPPGGENALLVDPATEDPLDFIQFRCVAGRWRPFARNGQIRGDETIRVAGLDRDLLLDFYKVHVNDHVRPEVETVRTSMRAGDGRAVHEAWQRAQRRLLQKTHLFAGLAHDALDALVSAKERAAWSLTLERPPLRPRGL